MIDVPIMLEKLGIEAERHGRDWVARCPSPDHDDRHPSWRIRDQDGVHYCHSCKFGGGAPDLVAAVYGFQSIGYAFHWLDKHGVTGEPESPDAVEVVLDQEDVYEEAPVMPSLRGIGEMSKWPTLHRRFAEHRGVTPDQARRWRLAAGVDGRLRSRLVMPVFDRHGRFARYTARALMGDQRARYLTPSREERPDWRPVHGEHLWPNMRSRDRVYVSEGALNAMALERVGARCVASLDGSRITSHQVMRLSTFKEIVLVSDPDPSGDQLASELTPLGRHRAFRIVRTPSGMDANDLERQYSNALRRLIG